MSEKIKFENKLDALEDIAESVREFKDSFKEFVNLVKTAYQEQK